MSNLPMTLLTGAAITVLMSANPVTAEETTELDPIQVWGTTVQSSLFEFDEDEITLRQADHLSDLLRIVPGVDIGGTHSVNSRINIRGLDDRQLAVYIDGALQTNYLYHHLGNILVNSDILTSAEIEVGANSLTHNGIGGTVRFKTKSAGDLLLDGRKYGGRAMGSYNDNAQTAWSLTGYGQLSDKFDILGYYNQIDRDNFEDGDGRSTIGSDGTTENLLLKFGFEPTENQRLQLSYDLLEDSGDYTQRPDMGVLTNQAISGDLTLPTEYTRETLNLSYDLDLGDLFLLSATYFTNDLELERDLTDPAARTRSGNTLQSAFSDNQGLNVIAETVVQTGDITHELTYGLQYFDQELNWDPDTTTPNDIITQSSETIGFFAENEISLSDQVRIRPGLRHETVDLNYAQTGESASFDDLYFGISGEFEPLQGLTLLAGITEIFQAPELAEPYGGGGENKIVNTNLEAESGSNIELGIRWQSHLFGGELMAGANIFETTIDDYITETDIAGSATGEVMDMNVGTIELSGYEASIIYTHGPWDVFLTHNSSEFDLSQIDESLISDSFREIGDTTSYEISHSFEDVGLSVALNGQFIQEIVSADATEKAGYDVHNIMARWNEPLGTKGLSFTAGIDNVFDTTYTSHASRVGEVNHPVFGSLLLNDVEPGRNIKLTIAQTF